MYLCTSGWPRVLQLRWLMHLIVGKSTLIPAGHDCAQVVSIRVQHSPCSCQVVILCVDIHGVLVHMAVCDRIKSVRDSEEVKYIIHLCQKGLANEETTLDSA